MKILELYKHCLQSIKQYPKIEEQIIQFYNIAAEKIEYGGAEQHECELAHFNIQELIDKL